MRRSQKIIGFLLVALLGAYGCAKGPVTQATGDTDKLAQAQVQRLEDDFRAAAAARDQFRQKMLAAEDQQVKLRADLDQGRAAAARDREALALQLKTHTAERDNLQAQYEVFRKSLKELLGQAETALPAGNGAAVAGR